MDSNTIDYILAIVFCCLAAIYCIWASQLSRQEKKNLPTAFQFLSYVVSFIAYLPILILLGAIVYTLYLFT